MNSLRIFKIGISAFVLVALVLMLWLFNSADLQSENFISNMLLSTFWTFLLFTSLVYRIALIGTEKFEWIPFLLFISLAGLIVSMKLFPESVFSLWDLTLILFILQVFQAFNRQVNGKGTFTKITKAGVIATSLVAVIGALTKPESTVFYAIFQITLLLTSLLVLIHYVIPKKKTN